MNVENLPMEPEIRPLTLDNKGDWTRLLEAYRAFYKVESTAESVERAWSWIADPMHSLEGIVAYVADRPVGFLLHNCEYNAVSGFLMGFVADIFVDPTFQKRGIGKKLAFAAFDIFERRGWRRAWWITDDNNFDGKRLYDKIARKTVWNVYTRDLSPNAGH